MISRNVTTMRTLILLTLLGGALLLAPEIESYPTGIGNVKDQGCYCHGSTPSSAVVPSLEGLPSEYNSSETYTLNISFTGGPSGSLENPNALGGFNLHASAGTLAAVDEFTRTNNPDGSATHNGSDKEDSGTGNDRTAWTVEWTPPAVGGGVTFILHTNSVNGNAMADSDDGDQWARLTISTKSEGSASGIEPAIEARGLTVLMSAMLLALMILLICVVYVFYRMNPDSFSWNSLWPWLRGWLTSTDHKRIGTLYFIAGLFFFMVGGIVALMMRIQLSSPGNDFLTEDEYNQFFTLHGTVMIFLAAMPLINGFANWIVPLQIGAKDMAFPRLNALSFWLQPVAAMLIFSGVFSASAADVGWTGYMPITASTSTHPGVTYWLAGQIMLVASSTLTGLNFIVTIACMRAPGMGWMQMPLFTWSILVSVMMLFLSIPAFGIGLIQAYLDRTISTAFFNVSAGGDPLLWSHLFWYFGHPEVYVVIVPAFGVISEVIATSARRAIFGYRSMVYAMAGIGILAFVVYGHHMLTSGMAPWLRFVMMVATFLVAVPTGIKIFNWIKTMHGGAIVYRTHTLWALGFLITFTLGGISGMFFPAISMDVALHETYFVVAHFHYVLVGGTIFGMFAAIYYWYPKMTGRMLNERLGILHFTIAFVAYNAIFWPMHRLGLWGMTRRHHTYFIRADEYRDVIGTLPPEAADWNMFISISAFIFGFSTLIMIYNMISSLAKGDKAPADPWGGWSFEWLTSSPPPTPSFGEIPTLIDDNPEHESGAVSKFFERVLLPEQEEVER
jgi:cytochrome c oxidase subunit 1